MRCPRCLEDLLIGGACRCAGMSRESVSSGRSALDVQEGGGHYKDMPIQPVEFITKNKIPYCEANAIKYLCRWRSKNGIEDLKKAKHYIDLLIELEADNPVT